MAVDEQQERIDDLDAQRRGLEQSIRLLHRVAKLVRSSLELEPTIYAILTATTAGDEGLGMNRAMLFLREGEARYVKNGEERVPHVDPSHPDLLSALFMPNGCSAHTSVHNGKDYFQLTLTAAEQEANGMRCTYDVVNEHDELTHATIWLGQIDGLLVPTRMDLEGALEGSLRLKG